MSMSVCTGTCIDILAVTLLTIKQSYSRVYCFKDVFNLFCSVQRHFEHRFIMIVIQSVLNLKVRKSACSSLGSLVILSEKFAGEALNLLVDMLNDDSVTVRLQALETMHIMVTCEHLNLEDKHMHMVSLLSYLCTKHACIYIVCSI